MINADTFLCGYTWVPWVLGGGVVWVVGTGQSLRPTTAPVKLSTGNSPSEPKMAEWGAASTQTRPGKLGCGPRSS